MTMQRTMTTQRKAINLNNCYIERLLQAAAFPRYLRKRHKPTICDDSCDLKR
jgi:hypothetical protein